MKIKFDDDAIRRMANDAARTRADRLQRVYDNVLEAGQGKTEAEVKELLAREWRSTFDGEITDPELSQATAVLAGGRRIKVELEVKGRRPSAPEPSM